MRKKGIYVLIDRQAVEVVDRIEDARTRCGYALQEKRRKYGVSQDSCRQMQIPTVYRDFQGRTQIQKRPQEKQITRPPLEMEIEVDD